MSIYVVPISFLPLSFVTLMHPVRRHLAWGWDVGLHPVLNGGVPGGAVLRQVRVLGRPS